MKHRLPKTLRGIQFWAPSFCRSTLGFYEALAQAFDVEFRICLAQAGVGARKDIGYTEAEFAHLELIVTEDQNAAAAALDQHPDWLQIFGIYQTVPHIQTTLAAAIERGLVVGIASEAPCNMEEPGLRRAAKAVYLNHVLPRRVAHVTQNARFILNWSGDDGQSLVALGWPGEKIVPLGYFPPPLPGTAHRGRDVSYHAPFRILSSSALTWHRGPDLLIEALTLLKGWDIPFEAVVTGDGPLGNGMRARAEAAKLPVEFLGRVPMDDLIGHYEGCSVFVAAGRQEPWGIRVNDALNAGAPTVASRGMGAVKLIDDYDVGASFVSGDVTDLAWQLRRLATDKSRYLDVCNNLAAARDALLPKAAAERVAPHIAALVQVGSAS